MACRRATMPFVFRNDRHDHWAIPFVASVGLLAAAAGFLVFVLADRSSGAGAGPQTAAPGPDRRAEGPLRIGGATIPGFDPGPGVVLADDGPFDLVFRLAPAGDLGTVAHRYFVPVVASGSGVQALSPEQVAGLLRGEITDWSRVGGLPGRVVVAAGPEHDRPVIESLVGPLGPAVPFASYDALIAAMTFDSGMVALVPVDAIRPSVMAVAVGDLDIVRGRGDPSHWPFVERVGIDGLTPRGLEALPSIVPNLAARPPEAITIVATGDILQSRCSLERIRASGDWGAALRTPVGAYLAAADLALGSLDGSIQDISEPYGCVETTNLTSPPQVIEALTVAGIDELTVATNHVFDCGRAFCGNRAFLRTLELLDQAGIRHAGGGKNLEEALAPVILEVRGVRFGILAFDDIAAMDLEATETAPGTAPLDDDYTEERRAGEPAFYRPAEELGLERFTSAIRSLKMAVDVVIVQVQSGTEDTHDPSPRSLKALRAAADAGADLVVGNQAHWVQAVEVRREAFIAYALGNFIFDQRHTSEHTEGVLLEATFFGRELAAVRLRPYRIVDQHRPEFVDAAGALKILAEVFSASARLPAVTP